MELVKPGKENEITVQVIFGMLYFLISVMVGLLIVGEESLRPGGFWLQR